MNIKSLSILIFTSLSSVTAFGQTQGQGVLPMRPPGPETFRYAAWDAPDFFEREHNYLPETDIKADVVKGNATTASGWQKGDIVLRDEDAVYADIELQYNQVINKIFVKGNKKVYVLNKPVKEFTISGDNSSRLFQVGFPSIEGNNSNTIYEVIHNGAIKLLKQEQKYVSIATNYDQRIEKRYDSRVKYYVNTGDTIFEVKPNTESYRLAINKLGLSGDTTENNEIKNESQLIAAFTKLP
ncbi:hypothetical protein [Pedobacter sp. BMA]|uniref:hypothetical protein n=1 Tax=Pedobacter sp. BMA TaxID=1663685 RepID=UPI00064AAAA0|nr:hypothetical protein [Pedobacter sp. BMA]KLT64688.1 hypothetical protein AB669_13090 [Pedobacter sp. BMA]